MSSSKIFKHDAQNPPEPGRLILCIGEDATWNFEVRGKFEAPEGGGRPIFYLERDDDSFIEDRYKWNHTRFWEYAQAPARIEKPEFAEAVEA